MNNPNDGGSAFPLEYHYENQFGSNCITHTQGMSLRDYFAIRATEEDIDWAKRVLSANGIPARRIEARWACADAMLTERTPTN
jgi:hypothetical protein